MRHPLHPVFVHVPIALLGTAPGFDAAGLVLGAPLFWATAFWNIVVGCTFGILAVATGLLDGRFVAEDSRPQPVLTRHLLVMLGALSCYGLSLVVRGGAGAPASSTLAAVLALEVVGVLLLHLGGGWGLSWCIATEWAGHARLLGRSHRDDFREPRSGSRLS